MDVKIDESQQKPNGGKIKHERSRDNQIGHERQVSTYQSRGPIDLDDNLAQNIKDGQFLPKHPSRIRAIQNAQTHDELQQLPGGPANIPRNQINPTPIVMRTSPSNTLGESYEMTHFSHNYPRTASGEEFSDSSKKQLQSNLPGMIYKEVHVENYIDQDLRKPKRKKFQNQNNLKYNFNSFLDPLDDTISKATPLYLRQQEQAIETTYALMRNKTQKPEDFKYDTGFVFGQNFAKDERMHNLFKGLAEGENGQEESAPIAPQANRRSLESKSAMGSVQNPNAQRQAPSKALAQPLASPRTAAQRKQSEKGLAADRTRPFERWPTVQALLQKARAMKKEAGGEEVEGHASSTSGTALEQILRRPYLPPDLIDHEDFLGQPGASLEGLMEEYARQRAHCYEIKPKVDFSNTEIMYSKRYFLPAIFGRFYTVQIERFTKSIQKEFDEMVKQNAYFNERINQAFEGARREMQDYGDPDYAESITASIGEQKKFAQKIQERMHSKFQEKLRVIQNYGTEDFREIYEYKVHLYAYDLSASDKVNSRFPQLREQKLKASMNHVSRPSSPRSQGGAERATSGQDETKASPQADSGGRDPLKELSDDNLIIEPVASIELAKFYSIEDQDNGLMFHKNLCDSFKVNEKQGALYILMQEKKKELFANQEGNIIKFVTRKLNYDQTELRNMDDFLHSTSPLVHHDLQELRNLKYKVLTYGTNSLAPNDADYHDKFFMAFPEKDIMSNCQMFALPKQLSRFVDQETREAEARQDEKRNIGEVELLEQQLVVTAKFVNPTRIKYEFRMLRNFQKIFEKEVRYKNLDSYDHGFERIQAFSEVKKVDKMLEGQRVDVEITVNVVDKQMINQYLVSFQRTPDLSLEFVAHEHQISYQNMLEGMDFTGRLVYDQQKYETYLISDELDFNQDINRDIRQRFRVQKLHTKESFEKQKHKKRAQLDQSGQSIYLEHDRILVSVASQTEIDLDKLKGAQAGDQTFEDLEELCSTNRLRNKFPQLRRELLQVALNRWLPNQGFLKLRRAASPKFLQRNKVEERIYVNSVDLSSDHSYLLVGIHVVEYLNDRARRAHVNKDIVISLQDLRSVTENQNPGFVSRPVLRDEIEPLVPINPQKYPAAKLEVEHVKRKALEVQQHLSLASKMRMKEVPEFEIYQEETVNPHDLDQRVLNYLKKTIDLFEYVNRVQILQFQENWKPANPHMLDKQRIVNVRSQAYSQFEKTISFKNLTILVLVDEGYLVSIRQTVVSVKRRDLVFEVKYFCPVYSDKLENASPTNDPYNAGASPEFHEGQALQVSDMYDCLEFYSQVKSYEESRGMADSRNNNDVRSFFGTYEDKAHVALKVLDRLSRQEKVFCGKLDRNSQTLEVYTTKVTVLDLFNQDLANGQLLPVQQLMSIDAESYMENILDMRLTFNNKSITIILMLKSGHVDMHEVIMVYDSVIRPVNQFRLVQSSSICLFQMQNGNIQSQINGHEDYSQQLQFLKSSKLLRHEDENYMPEMFANIPVDRKLVIFTIMLDEKRNQRLEPWEKPKLKYYALELDLEALSKNLSCSARHYKVRNYVLTHRNGYGILYGCKDEPIMLQHHPFSQELVTVVGARLSVVDFSRELMFQEATKTMHHARMREWLNKRTQTAFFSEREKLRVCGEMHLAMRSMQRNIMFGDLVLNLEGFNGKTPSQAIRAQFSPQEFLFGQVGLATMLQDPSRVRRIIDSVSGLGVGEQVDVIKQLCLRRDCNLGTLIESCISIGHTTSLKIILGKFMDNHGPLTARGDQEAVKSLQSLLNELSPLVLQNQGIADFLTNLKHFRFGVFSSKLESEDHQSVWNNEAELAKYPNQNLPEDNLLAIQDFKMTEKQRNVADILPRGPAQIFDALREKLFEQRSSIAKTNGFLKKSKCAKSCLRQGKTSSDSSNLGAKDYPCFLYQYHVIDFKLVEYGYKRVQKLYARREYRDYQPIHLKYVEEQRQTKLAAEARRKRTQDAINWVKSLREESKEERAQRLEKEAAAQRKEEEELADGEDEDGQNELLYENWVPKTANQRLAATLPHYIEPFSERKVTDMMTLQISDFLAGHQLQARLNESMDTEGSVILYSKDIEAFVLHRWKATAARLELSRHVFTLACFLIPFMVDGYAAAGDYEMVDARTDYSSVVNSLSTTDAADVQYGLKGVGIFATLALLVYEFTKAAASDRNKYAALLSSQSHDVVDDRANAINVSLFNVILFVIYVSWSVGSVRAQIEIGKFKQAAVDQTQSAEDLALLANDINWNQQILQLLHIFLLVSAFLMALDMLQMISKNVHRTIEILKHNFIRFTSLSVIFLIFNIIIGVASKWNSQISTGFGQEVDMSKEGFVTASWEEVGSFYKTVRVFAGGVVFEFLNYSNDRTQLQRFWAVSALQVVCQIYIVIFILALLFTFVETAIQPRSLKHDRHDLKFLTDKNMQNLEYQELEAMVTGADQWMRLTYRRAKVVTSLINRIKRAWRKFMGELGIEERVPIQRLKSDSSKYLVFNYRI